MPLDPADLEHLMNQARIELTGVSDSGIKTTLFNVLHEFFNDTLAWREHIELLVTANQQHYRLVPKDGGRIFALFGVWDGNRIPVPAFMPEPPHIQIHQHIQTTSIPTTTVPGQPQPLGATNPWLVTVAENVKKPTDSHDIPLAPGWVLRTYLEIIIDGLLGRLMGQPAKSYSNQTMSSYHLRRFRAGIATARTAAARQNTIGAQTWAYPLGWNARTQRGGVSTPFPVTRF